MAQITVRPHFLFLDFLRGVAAFSVVILHWFEGNGYTAFKFLHGYKLPGANALMISNLTLFYFSIPFEYPAAHFDLVFYVLGFPMILIAGLNIRPVGKMKPAAKITIDLARIIYFLQTLLISIFGFVIKMTDVFSPFPNIIDAVVIVLLLVFSGYVALGYYDEPTRNRLKQMYSTKQEGQSVT